MKKWKMSKAREIYLAAYEHFLPLFDREEWEFICYMPSEVFDFLNQHPHKNYQVAESAVCSAISAIVDDLDVDECSHNSKAGGILLDFFLAGWRAAVEHCKKNDGGDD